MKRFDPMRTTLPLSIHNTKLCSRCWQFESASRNSQCIQCQADPKQPSIPLRTWRLVWYRDYGKCANCGLDTRKLQAQAYLAKSRKAYNELLLAAKFGQEDAGRIMWVVAKVNRHGSTEPQNCRTICRPCWRLTETASRQRARSGEPVGQFSLFGAEEAARSTQPARPGGGYSAS